MTPLLTKKLPTGLRLNDMSLTLMILIFVTLLLAGMPIAFVMGFSASLYLLFSPEVSFLDMAPQKLFAGIDSFVLMCIPFFLLAGEILTGERLRIGLSTFAISLWGDGEEVSLMSMCLLPCSSLELQGSPWEILLP